MASRFARLSTGDRTFLRVEYTEAPEHVAGLCTMDGSALRAPSGALDLDLIRRRIASRISRVPKLRQRAWRPPFLGGGEVWIDDCDFAVERHIRSTDVPPPGDESQLLEAVELILRSPLDRANPLWELWFLDGLEDGRVATVFKIHHAVADGLGAVALVSALLDFEPDADDPVSNDWVPSRPPSWRQLFLDNLSTRLDSLAGLIAHPLRAARAFATVITESRHVLTGMYAAPRTSLNAPASGIRHARVVRLDLETARSIAHAHGAKVNDVVLAVIGSGVHELLVSRAEDDRAFGLTVMVAATLRKAEDAKQLGNVSGGYLARLPLGARDPLRRLEDVAAATREAKRHERPTTNQRMLELVGKVGLIKWMGERQRVMNVMTTNVPGPPVPLYLLGARVDDVVAFITPVGNVTLAFAALSYCGRLNILVNADARACPDLDVLATAMRNMWVAMRASLAPAA
jgi:diacylglycerol O-acyltransferase